LTNLDPVADALARLYDLDLVDDPGDVDLYLALAHRTAAIGPVVELAAGSGRVAIPLAEAGHPVVAVDRDPAMLARGRACAERSLGGVALGDRLTWLEADLVDVDRAWVSTAPPGTPGGPGTFGLAILAVGSILLLPDADRQRAAVATMARLLAPGGVAVIDAWLLGPDELAGYDGRTTLEWVRTDPETGAQVTKVATGHHEPGGDRLQLTTTFEEVRPGQPAVRWRREDTLRLLEVDELLAFLTDAGLVVEAVAGDPEMTPLEPDADRVVVVARRPRAP